MARKSVQVVKKRESKLQALTQRFDVLRAAARKFYSDTMNRERKEPFFYAVGVGGEGKPLENKVNIVRTDELYSHVQTANVLGFMTELRADAGKLTVIFARPIPPQPREFWQ